MANNRIGWTNPETVRPGAVVREDPRDPDDRPPGDASPGGNTLFASILIVIVIIGAGALAASDRAADFRRAVWEDVMGPPPEPAYQSRVASVCDKGWRDDRDNRDQVDCYMTTDVERLCDPRERRALVDKLRRLPSRGPTALIGRAAGAVLQS